MFKEVHKITDFLKGSTPVIENSLRSFPINKYKLQDIQNEKVR